jgi:hypothetical protein
MTRRTVTIADWPLLRKRVNAFESAPLTGLLIAGRGHNAQRPDAGRSATCEAEPRQHVLTGENDEDSTGRVVQHSLLVLDHCEDGRPWRRNITDRLTHSIQIMNITRSRSYNR